MTDLRTGPAPDHDPWTNNVPDADADDDAQPTEAELIDLARERSERDAQVRTEAENRGHAEPTAAETVPFEALSHDEAKVAPLPEGERELIEDIIPSGGVGTIASVPETGKSYLAQAIATRCAHGDGEVLGYRVVRKARVGYFWQDDSRREELERIRAFEQAHETAPGLPLLWFLNVGLQLPRDLSRMRATIEHYRLELVILDSFYNFAFGLNLREADA
jgi:hypothetical protein